MGTVLSRLRRAYQDPGRLVENRMAERPGIPSWWFADLPVPPGSVGRPSAHSPGEPDGRADQGSWRAPDTPEGERQEAGDGMQEFCRDHLMLLETARPGRHADLIHFLEARRAIVICAPSLETVTDAATVRRHPFTHLFCDIDSYGGPEPVRPYLQRIRAGNPGLCVMLMSDEILDVETMGSGAPECDLCMPAAMSFGRIEAALAEARRNNAIRQDGLAAREIGP